MMIGHAGYDYGLYDPIVLKHRMQKRSSPEVPDDIADEKPPKRLADLSWLGPMVLQVSPSTDMPIHDYAVVTALDIRVIKVSQEPRKPAIFVLNSVCADGDPVTNDAEFNAILPAHRGVLSLLGPVPKKHKRTSITIRQQQPSSFRIYVRARSPGWYEFVIALRYTYRRKNYSVVYPYHMRMFYASKQSYIWYNSGPGEPLKPLSKMLVSHMLERLNEFGGQLFPPKPVPASLRSGRVSSH
jgi:hypothetical protein